MARRIHSIGLSRSLDSHRWEFPWFLPHSSLAKVTIRFISFHFIFNALPLSPQLRCDQTNCTILWSPEFQYSYSHPTTYVQSTNEFGGGTRELCLFSSFFVATVAATAVAWKRRSICFFKTFIRLYCFVLKVHLSKCVDCIRSNEMERCRQCRDLRI